MTRVLAFVATTLSSIALLSGRAIGLEDSSWALGFWQQISDEDHGPAADYFEVLRDGTLITHGYCIDSRAAGYELSHWHIHGGDLYQTIEIDDKGPVALIFRPNQARSRLTYTSPRTKNNAVYEHRATDPCAGGAMKGPRDAS